MSRHRGCEEGLQRARGASRVSFWGLGDSDLVLEHLEAGRLRSPARDLPESGCAGPVTGPRLRTFTASAGRTQVPQPSRWALPQRGPAALPGSVRTPSHAAASTRSVPSHRHPPRGLLPAPASRGCTPPRPRYLGLSKLHPLRRSAALFCRRSAAAAPPGSGSIARGGGRRLGHTRVGSGLGSIRPDAPLARRSPRPAPHPLPDPKPRPCPAPNSSPVRDLRPRPERLPNHSLTLSVGSRTRP